MSEKLKDPERIESIIVFDADRIEVGDANQLMSIPHHLRTRAWLHEKMSGVRIACIVYSDGRQVIFERDDVDNVDVLSPPSGAETRGGVWVSLGDPSQPSSKARATRDHSPKLEGPPARLLVAIGRTLLDAAAYRRYVEPHVADVYHEYFEALSRDDYSGARKVVLWGYVRALWPLLNAAWRTVVALLKVSGA